MLQFYQRNQYIVVKQILKRNINNTTNNYQVKIIQYILRNIN